MTIATSTVGRLPAATDTAREPAPRQPLFPCKYETWLSRRNGREVAVIDYDEDLGQVEYMYFGGAAVYLTRSDTWTKRFVYVRCP